MAQQPATYYKITERYEGYPVPHGCRFYDIDPCFLLLLVSYRPLAHLRVRVRFPQTHYGGGLPRAPRLKSPHPGVWRSPGDVARIRASNLSTHPGRSRSKPNTRHA